MPRMSRLNEQSQKILLNVVKYFELEEESFKPLHPPGAVFEKAAHCSGVCKSSLRALVKKGVTADKEFLAKRKTQTSKTKKAALANESIRERLYIMIAEGRHVTVRSLFDVVKEADGYKLSRTTMFRTLKDIGLKWQRDEVSHRKCLMEQSHIAFQRTQFLREFTQNKLSGLYKPVYLDERWINAKGAFHKLWQDGSSRSAKWKASEEGVRYIILNAGGEVGFVPNASLLFRSHSKMGDYHNSMNAINFEMWFKEQLIPNLSEPSLIIMDNAPYHNTILQKIPKQSWTKAAMMNWLDERKIKLDPGLYKYEVWEVVKMHLPPKVYRLDEYAEENGHKVLRLPPYHCQYNPIELVWSQAKRFYDAHSTNHPSDENTVLERWMEALENVSTKDWTDYHHHTEEIIGQAWETAEKIDSCDAPPLVIYLREDCDDSDYSIGLSDELTEDEESD